MTPDLRDRLRARLADAMRARESVVVGVLRATLAAIDNAEAPPPTGHDLRATAIEQSPYGVGAREVARRALSEADVREIVRREAAERTAAIDVYLRAGDEPRAARLRAEAAVLQDLMREGAG